MDLTSKAKQGIGFALGVALGAGGTATMSKQDINVDGKPVKVQVMYEDACGTDGSDPSKVKVVTALKDEIGRTVKVSEFKKDQLSKENGGQ